MNADYVGILEECFTAGCNFEAFGLGARGRPLPAPAHYVHAERFAHARNGGSDMAEGVDAERVARQAGADGRVPIALLETFDFERNIAQRREDQGPRELSGGGVGSAAAATARGDDDAALRASGEIEVVDIAAGLADEFQVRQAFDDLPCQAHTLLRENYRIATGDLLDHARGIDIGIGMNRDGVILESGVGPRRAQYIGVVVNHCDLHGVVPRCLRGLDGLMLR